MPSGSMPRYKYRPANGGEKPQLRGRSTRRARLFAGGTYFRAKDPGLAGNNISIEVLEYVSEIPGEEGELKGKVIITNHNISYGENVIGPADVDLLDVSLKWDERYTIENLTTAPTTRKYSISFKIAPALSLQEELGPFTFGKLLYVANQLSIKLTPRASEFTPSSVITIKPRTRVYDLVMVTKTSQPTETAPSGTTSSGWDIDDLRTKVQGDPWIEMLKRSGEPKTPAGGTGSGGDGGGGAPTIKYDAQDTGTDDDFLSAFEDRYLTGGDGLPDNPNVERTGPTRSIVYVAYGERYDGTMGESNEVYEWAGDSASAGSWVKY